MTKEQLKQYINEAVDAMEDGDLNTLFPASQQPDLYAVIHEMTGLRGEVKRLSQSSLRLNNQLQTSAEEQRQEWKFLSETMQETTGKTTKPLVSEEEVKALILKLVEQDDSLQRMNDEFAKIATPTIWTLHNFKEQLASWSKGFEINHRQWGVFFNQIGIYKTGMVGEKFNPNHHEVIATKNDISKNQNTILETELTGIIYKNILIRRAKVVVNKG